MTPRRGRVVALALGVLGLCAIAPGIANASGSVVDSTWMGPYLSETDCSAESAALNDPPEITTGPCEYHSTLSLVTPAAAGPTGPNGWYFLLVNHPFVGP